MCKPLFQLFNHNAHFSSSALAHYIQPFASSLSVVEPEYRINRLPWVRWHATLNFSCDALVCPSLRAFLLYVLAIHGFLTLT
jgi:hypothetical protein